MKARILGFFFSLLIVAGAKGQTIDGVLYTNFNNYYKWRGGGFDSTLLIPIIPASIGRRAGAIYYKSADSSLYSWTGTQWRKVGDGASIPTLQQVTTAGKVTTDTIKAAAFRIPTAIGSDVILSDDGQAYRASFKIAGSSSYAWLRGSQLELINGSGFNGTLNNTNGTKSNTINLPDSSGVLTQRVSINGVTNNTATNGVVDLGNVDTATVVKAYVTNAEAITITKGQVVYIFGASGDRAAVKLAKNTSDTFSSKTLGIVRTDIAAGQAGWVTTQGQVSGINLGAYTAGDILWLDSVAGGFTKTKPVAPYHSVFVGVVERANAGNGLIYVKPQNGQEIGELHDTKITNPKTGDAITYTASSDIWENRQVVLKQDTIPLAVFNVGSAAAGDTAAFSTSTLAGSFYLDGTDTMFITSYLVALQGTSASITPEVWFNDSLNVTAGGTRLATGSAITNLTTGTSVTATTNKIPPGNFVFVRFSAVTTKPTYFTLTLFGYRIRKQ